MVKKNVFKKLLHGFEKILFIILFFIISPIAISYSIKIKKKI